MEVQALAWEAGGGFDAPEEEEGSSPHALQEGGRLPTTSQPWWFLAQEQFPGLSFLKKKS